MEKLKTDLTTANNVHIVDHDRVRHNIYGYIGDMINMMKHVNNTKNYP